MLTPRLTPRRFISPRLRSKPRPYATSRDHFKIKMLLELVKLTKLALAETGIHSDQTEQIYDDFLKYYNINDNKDIDEFINSIKQGKFIMNI